MKFHSIRSKLFFISLVAVLLTATAVLAPLLVNISDIIFFTSSTRMESSMQAMEGALDSMRDTSMGVSQTLAQNSALANAVANGDIAMAESQLESLVRDVINFSNPHVVLVTDAEGNVLTRLHSDRRDDSIIYRSSVSRALSPAGSVTSEMQSETEVSVGIISTVPIRLNNQIVGTVVAGYDLTDPSFVDRIQYITGTEVTVFSGVVAAMSTIRTPTGERSTGIAMSDYFQETVVYQRQTYTGRGDVIGVPFLLSIRPVLDYTDNYAGAIFVGQSMAVVTQMERMARYLAFFLIAVVAIFVLIIITFINGKMIVKPIKDTTEALELLSRGHLAINTELYQSKDEIGQLARSTARTSRTLLNVLDDLTEFVKRRADGDTRSRFDATKYQGSFATLVEQLNDMFETEAHVDKVVLTAIDSFTNGNFEHTMETLSGDRSMYNVTLEKMQNNLKDISGQCGMLLEHALNGVLDKRANISHLHGGWKHILSQMNLLMDAINTPLAEATAALDNMANGNFAVHMSGQYKGVFENIKIALNSTEDALASYIKEIARVLTNMSNDNFDLVVSDHFRGDFEEIESSLNILLSKFNHIISSISGSAGEVLAGARQVSESSSILAEGASSQTAAVEELTSSMDILTDRIKENFETSREVSELSANSKATVNLGNTHMQSMLGAMQSISDASNNISQILKTIDGIAFQTNLLALNAAIEAARAGEQGKGFSVVAEEVRVLSNRSETAAKESSALVEDTLLKIEQGQEAAQEAARTFEVILGDVEKVAQLIVNIETQSQEQSETLNHINSGVKMISDVVMSNSSISEESAASSEVLSSSAEAMDNMVKIFKLKKL
ncbi:MAG: methyl-accepting chemotaxis protein [Defluviitaleaceae bacterium]|nr:methyl-accepting chemotaxis protein [Defluviitaleaceae bacterium]